MTLAKRTFRLIALTGLFLRAVPLAAGPSQTDVPGTFAAEAEEAYRKALELRAAGRLTEAEGLFTEALHKNPQNAAYHFELANLYAAKHDEFRSTKAGSQAGFMLERVASELEQTVMLDPSFLPAKFNLGVVYKRLGRFERAREVLREVMEEAKRRGESGVEFNTLMQIGAAYEEQGFYDEAEDIYLQAKNLDYFNSDIQGALEDLDRQRETYKTREALESYTRAMDYRRSFGYSPFSHAAQHETERRMADGGGVAGALPYLSMMLVQQFLNRDGRAEE